MAKEWSLLGRKKAVTRQAADGRYELLLKKSCRTRRHSSYRENPNRLRFPSPQRGRGARGEGGSRQLDALASVPEACPRSDYRWDCSRIVPPSPPTPLPSWGEERRAL